MQRYTFFQLKVYKVHKVESFLGTNLLKRFPRLVGKNLANPENLTKIVVQDNTTTAELQIRTDEEVKRGGWVAENVVHKFKIAFFLLIFFII